MPEMGKLATVRLTRPGWTPPGRDHGSLGTALRAGAEGTALDFNTDSSAD